MPGARAVSLISSSYPDTHFLSHKIEHELGAKVYLADWRLGKLEDDVVLVLPADKAGFLMFGIALGQGKRGYILLDNPDRWDVMFKFATGVFDSTDDLIAVLNSQERPTSWPKFVPDATRVVYLIGSLRNPKVPQLAKKIRELTGIEVFDDWYAAGPEADDYWRDYEKGRGRTLTQAIRESLAADHVFQFDLTHLKRADTAVLMLPAGKSGHIELGWELGQDKKGYVLLDQGEGWNPAYNKLVTGVFDNLEELIEALRHGQRS